MLGLHDKTPFENGELTWKGGIDGGVFGECKKGRKCGIEIK